MSAMTSEDVVARPETDVPPSRRLKSSEQLAAEIEELDGSNFVLSGAGKARRKELADALAEQMRQAAVDRAAILQTLKSGEEIESVANAAVAALEQYVTLREQLLELRRPYDVAWQSARDLGIETGPRVRIRPPIGLTNRLLKTSHWPWYL